MLSIKVDGESCLCDVAVMKYGNIEALFALVTNNGLSFDAVPDPESDIIIPSLAIVKKLARINERTVPVYPFVQAGGDQALIDLAMQETGTFETLMEMARLNGISITDDLQVKGSYRKTDVVDERIVTVFAGTLKPASNVPVDEDQLPTPPEGIDYWIIENTFIVS
jgi:hypothetical protein